MFHKGQKVECVEAGFDENFHHPQLKLGATYVVDWCGQANSHGLVCGGRYACARLAVTLVGVGVYEDARYYAGPDFAAERFRPICNRKTDISVFKAMLNPTRKLQKASAK